MSQQDIGQRPNPGTSMCSRCDSPESLASYADHCPVCGALLDGRRDRRTASTVPFVRDWITALRLQGGDFDEIAAHAANEIAFECVVRRLHPQEIFDAARAAYYSALPSTRGASIRKSSNAGNRAALSMQPTGPQRERGLLSETA